MTIDAVVGCRDTGNHVQDKKKFYPSNIPILHYQLRHLITSPAEGLIYFVNSRDVYCIDTATKKRTHVAELPFDAMCTATAHGWFCAGGRDNGNFAAFRLPEAHGGQQQQDRAFSDERPSDIFNSAHDPIRSGIFERHGWSAGRARSSRVRIEKLGVEILNSISIHRLHDARVNGGEDDVVAILTNNDRTVRMYSLTNDVELCIDYFEFSMNHATISPDGRMLMIVGDKEWAYFYDCKDTLLQSKNKNNGDPGYEADTMSTRWTLIQKVRLYKPARVDAAGYFTTAWSQSGKLCATASDNGFITVFDTEALWHPDRNAIAAIVPSSRPNEDEGAVRTMAFAPEPWDLLVWTEHCGRAGVGDLRNGLASRQIVDLDSKAEDVTRIDLIDTTHILSNNDMDLAYEALISGNPADFTSHHLDEDIDAIRQEFLLASRDRRQLQRRAGIPENEIEGLGEAERRILEGVRTASTARQRHNAISDLSTIRSVMHSGNTDPNSREGQNAPRYPLQAPRLHLSRYVSRPSTLSAVQASENSVDSDRYWNDIRSGEHRGSSSRDAAVLGTIRDYIREQGWDSNNGNESLSYSGGDSASARQRQRLQQRQQQRRDSVILTPSSSATPPPDSGGGRPIENNSNTGASTTDRSDDDEDGMPGLGSAEPGSQTRSGLSNLRQASNRARNVTTEPRVAYSGARSRWGLLTSMDNESPMRVVNSLDNTVNRATLRARTWGRDDDMTPHEAALYSRVSGPAVTANAVYRNSYGEGVDEYLGDARSNIGTTGIAFSDGGRTLFLGTNEGIFEMKMNFQERKFWPAFAPR